MQNKAVISDVSLTSLNDFEKDILQECLAGTIFENKDIRSIGQVGNQYVYDCIVKNRRYFIKILLDSKISHDREISILKLLDNSSCAPNFFLHKTEPYELLVVECPNTKIYHNYEGVKNNELLPETLSSLHQLLKAESDEMSHEKTLDFFGAFSSIENFSVKTDEMIHELRRIYNKIANTLPSQYVISSLNFTPYSTLHDGSMFMPVDWSNPTKINKWIEVGSVFLFFGCQSWERFVTLYGESCDSKQVLSIGSIHNLIYAFLFHSVVSSSANSIFGSETSRKLLVKTLNDVFNHCGLSKSLITQVKSILKL